MALGDGNLFGGSRPSPEVPRLLRAPAKTSPRITALNEYLQNSKRAYRNEDQSRDLRKLLNRNTISAQRESFRALSPTDLDQIAKARQQGKSWFPNKPTSSAGQMDTGAINAQLRNQMLYSPENDLAPGNPRAPKGPFGDYLLLNPPKKGSSINEVGGWAKSGFGPVNKDNPVLARIAPMTDVPGIQNVNDFSTVTKSLLNEESLFSPDVKYKIQDYTAAEPLPKKKSFDMYDFLEKRQLGSATLRPYLPKAFGALNILDVIPMLISGGQIAQGKRTLVPNNNQRMR